MQRRRILLINPQNRYAQEGRCRGGQYALFEDDNLTTLGDTVRARVLSAMPKAVQFVGDGEVVVSYHRDSQLFKQIRDQSYNQDAGCTYGVEFLLGLAEGIEAEFYFGTKSLRREAVHLYKCVGHDVILSALKMEYHKFLWYIPDIWVRFKDTQGFKPPIDYLLPEHDTEYDEDQNG